MSSPVWREELFGTSLGIFFLTVFGFVWASLGTSVLPGSAFYLIASAVVSVALVLAGFYLRRAARSATPMPHEMMRSGVTKRFRTVFLIEGVAIAVSAFVLGRVGYPELIPSVAALIVGFHFFPLAPLFRVRAYYVTGALLCLIFLLTVVLAPLSGGQALWFAVPGIGSAVVLWVTGAALFATRMRLARSG